MPERAKHLAALLRDLSSASRGGGKLPLAASLASPAESDRRFQHVLEHMGAFLSEVDEDGCLAYVSPTAEHVTGFPAAELMAREDAVPVREDELATLARQAGGRPPRAVYRARHRDGHWIWLETTPARRIRTPAGAVHSVALTRDVTELKRAAASLWENQERYRLVTEVSRDHITEFDAEGLPTFVSGLSEESLGYAIGDMAEIEHWSLLHPDDRARVEAGYRDALASPRTVRIAPHRVRHKDGHWRWFETTAISYLRADGDTRLLVVGRDVTQRMQRERERRKFEERMRQAQRLESLGVVAGGIAHDFNNLLTPILGDASLALLDLPSDSPARARLQRVQEAAKRAAALTGQMLAYAGGEPFDFEALDLSKLVLEMGRLLESVVSGKTLLAYELDAHLPSVDGDASQLSQVVMNLVTNAAEAVGDGEGRIAIRTGALEVGPRTQIHAYLGEPLREGPHAFVEVEDTGCGMDSDTRSRIFEPFFTTKFAGRGLGLAAALGIVRGHGGAIELESEPSRGTRTRIVLPAASADSTRSSRPSPSGRAH